MRVMISIIMNHDLIQKIGSIKTVAIMLFIVAFIGFIMYESYKGGYSVGADIVKSEKRGKYDEQ